MRKKLGMAATVAVVAAFGVAPSGASAAHCVSPDGSSPGFSYFGNDHNQEAHQSEGKNNGAHSPGASSCRDAGSPSERAPGKNKG